MVDAELVLVGTNSCLIEANSEDSAQYIFGIIAAMDLLDFEDREETIRCNRNIFSQRKPPIRILPGSKFGCRETIKVPSIKHLCGKFPVL